MKTVTVNADALRQVLEALNGPGHLIRELQYTRGPLVGHDNPINILVKEFNQAVVDYDADNIPTMENDGFVDKAIATVSITLWESANGGMTNAVQLLVRPADVRGDESGAHPGESFVMVTIIREEVREMLQGLDDDWADQMKFAAELPA